MVSDNSEHDITPKLKTFPNRSNFSNSMRERLGSLKNSRYSSKFTQNEFSKAKILGILFQILGGDRMKKK